MGPLIRTGTRVFDSEDEMLSIDERFENVRGLLRQGGNHQFHDLELTTEQAAALGWTDFTGN